FQIPLYLIVLSALLCTINTSPVSYQYVRFIRNERMRAAPATRRSRSYGFSNNEVFSSTHVWNGDDILHPRANSLIFEEHRGHVTPDFSNGLSYPDPLLLTGRAAKRAASVLYRKPLFFEEINHVESLLSNQEQRRRSGLAGNKLGSLRPHLPFYRFKQDSYRYFK
ncbi:uncharacterized protein BDFB_006912, partial [Asbolus verrucosus]